MNGMLEAEIWGIAGAGDGGMVFLRPLDSGTAVPIFIGNTEVQSILIGCGSVAVPRPLTHDLLLDVVRRAGLLLLRVEIGEIRDNTFFAGLVLGSPAKPEAAELRVDSRPSDAIALAVRCKCPIYLAEKVLREAGVPADGLVEAGAPEGRREELRAELDAAVAVEDYENAARIRDMIKLLDKP